MPTKFAVNWAQIVAAFRSAGTLMILQGLLFGFLVESPLLTSWAKFSVLVGLLFWAGASMAKQQDI